MIRGSWFVCLLKVYIIPGKMQTKNEKFPNVTDVPIIRFRACACACRLVGWSAGRLVGWSAGRLIGWSPSVARGRRGDRHPSHPVTRHPSPVTRHPSPRHPVTRHPVTRRPVVHLVVRIDMTVINLFHDFVRMTPPIGLVGNKHQIKRRVFTRNVLSRTTVRNELVVTTVIIEHTL